MNNYQSIKIAIVISTFNKDISDNLLQGAINKFEEFSNDRNNLLIFSVPGAFEIPGAVSKILSVHKDIEAIVTLGCVIKGETAHFEYISSSVTDSISNISLKANIPIIYGVLTTYNYEQALIRSDFNQKNKGGEVMECAFKTIDTYRNIEL
tara:strand:+ start:1020 stop:1472 length:453 start_codon:yes stop_codon:yes gene_type:complete